MALRCAIRPFGEVTPEIFPCGKAGRAWRIAEVSTQCFRAGMRRLSCARSESGSGACSPPVSTAAAFPDSIC